MGCRTVRIGDIVRLEDSKRQPLSSRDREDRKGDYPYYGAQGVVDYLDDYTYDGDYLLVAEDGENLRSRKQPIANAARGRFRVNNHAHVVAATERCNLIYLRYLLNSMDIAAYVTGSTQPKLSQTSLLNMNIELPEIEEQNTVAAYLDCFDTKIATNTKLNGYLAELEQAIYADSTREGTLTTIGEIAEVIDCLHSKKPQRQPSGKPLIQLNNIIDDGILDMTDAFYISEDDYAKWISRCEVKPGDCVITNVGRIGAVSQVPRGTTAAMGRNMTCIRPGAYAATIITALCSNAMRYEIEKRTDAGTIMNALNVRNIPKLELYLPPAKVRDSVETTLKTIQDTRELLLKERQELSALRDALLPKLISGEIDVSGIDLTQLNSHLA